MGYQSFISSDGASPMFSAMKYSNNFGDLYSYLGYTFALNPKNFAMENSYAMPALQDVLHLVNKLRNRIFDPTNNVVMGKFLVTNAHLRILIENENVSKQDHLLTPIDVGADKTHDKMNTSASEKVCSPIVISLMEKFVPGSEGTRLYLRLMNCLLNAFVRTNITPRMRLFEAIYCSSVARRWIEQLKTEGKSFDSSMTKHCFECIELNLSFALQLIMEGDSELITMCGSQACEKFFRLVRSLSPLESTQINFNLHELMGKMKRVKFMQQTMRELQNEGFK